MQDLMLSLTSSTKTVLSSPQLRRCRRGTSSNSLDKSEDQHLQFLEGAHDGLPRWWFQLSAPGAQEMVVTHGLKAHKQEGRALDGDSWGWSGQGNKSESSSSSSLCNKVGSRQPEGSNPFARWFRNFEVQSMAQRADFSALWRFGWDGYSM